MLTFFLERRHTLERLGPGACRARGRDAQLSLPPGFVGVLSGGRFDWLSVHPIDVARCSVRTGSAVATAPGAAGRLARSIAESVSAAAYPMVDFLPEDKAICERVQRGVAGDFAPGRLVPMERVVADFGHYLDWRLNHVEPPPVHTETTRMLRSGATEATEPT